MDELRQSSLEDVASLQMENELLLYEVRHVRAQLASIERTWTEKLLAKDRQLERRNRQLDRRDRELERREKELGRLRNNLNQLERARDDLAWLVRRLHSSPARILLVRRPGYRRLVKLYGPSE